MVNRIQKRFRGRLDYLSDTPKFVQRRSRAGDDVGLGGRSEPACLISAKPVGTAPWAWIFEAKRTFNVIPVHSRTSHEKEKILKAVHSVLETLDRLESHIPHAATNNENVSKWSVGMQIEHCLLGTYGICKAVAQSERYTGKIKKGIPRRYVFLTGTIPRGRGRAPEAGLPKEATTPAELTAFLEKVRGQVTAAVNANADGYWNHFIFGIMKRDDALKFVAIHNNHHLKIIADILAKA